MGSLTSDVNHDQIRSIKEMMKILKGEGKGRPVKDCKGYGDGEDQLPESMKPYEKPPKVVPPPFVNLYGLDMDMI